MSEDERGATEALETRPEPDREAMARAVADFLRAAGLTEAASGDAPARTARAWAEELLSGYQRDPLEVLENTWPDQTGDIVSLCGVPFVSVCAHHLLPFYGTACLAYLPAGRLTGLSRLANLVETLSRRLQVQERLTEEVADALMEGLSPRGAAVLVEATHDCVGARNLQHRDATVQTAAYRGDFMDDAALQDRFLRLSRRGAYREASNRWAPTGDSPHTERNENE